MAIRVLRVEPDPILSIKTAHVEHIDAALQVDLDDMLETMYAIDGLGLAANQVGLNRRMFVMDTSARGEAPNPLVLINPEVLWLSDEKFSSEEGCLSVPGAYAPVVRSYACRVQFLDRMGATQTLEAQDLTAACIQHEIDHLNGILFIDHLTHLKRSMVVSKSRKTRARKA